MHGDKVQRARPRARARAAPRARSSQVLERGMKRVAGTLRRKGKSAWLEPDDSRVRGPIVLPRAIDAGGPEGNSGNDGDAVVVTHHALARAARREPGGRARGGARPPGRARRSRRRRSSSSSASRRRTPTRRSREAEAFGDEVPAPMKEGREDLRAPPAADHRSRGRARPRRRRVGRAHASAAATARGSPSPT